MAVSFELTAENRSTTGTSAARKMRRQDNTIPAVVYGAGKPNQSITLPHNKVVEALENEAFYSHIITLHIDGKGEKAILKDIQRHPYKPKVLHLDFQRVSAKEKLSISAPLHFVGEDVAVGVKQKGGVVSHMETTVEISCLPADLPEFIEVDISQLDLDQTIHLSELKLPKGVELIELQHENDLPIVSIHLPKAQVVEEPTEAAAEEKAAEAEEEKPKEEDKKE